MVGEDVSAIKVVADNPNRTKDDVALVLLEMDIAVPRGVKQNEPCMRRCRSHCGAELRDQSLPFVMVAGNRHRALCDRRIEFRRRGESLDLPDRLPSPMHQPRAPFGGGDAVALPNKQWVLKGAAQSLDRVADRGLVDVEPFGRRGERSQVVHQDKRAQRADVYRIDGVDCQGCASMRALPAASLARVMQYFDRLNPVYRIERSVRIE